MFVAIEALMPKPANAGSVFLDCSSLDGKQKAIVTLHESEGVVVCKIGLTPYLKRATAFFAPKAISWDNGERVNALEVHHLLDRTTGELMVVPVNNNKPTSYLVCSVGETPKDQMF